MDKLDFILDVDIGWTGTFYTTVGINTTWTFILKPSFEPHGGWQTQFSIIIRGREVCKHT